MQPAPDVDTLRSILRAREESVRTFQADLTVVETPGSQLPEIAAERLKIIDWIEANNPEIAAEAARNRPRVEGMRRSQATSTDFHRYFAEPSGKLRIEVYLGFEGSQPKSSTVSNVRVFTGEVWKAYVAETAPKTGEKLAHLTVSGTERENLCWHEIARGAGVQCDELFEMEGIGFTLSRRARAASVLSWSELLTHVPPERSRAETSVPPGGTNPSPSLILETKPFRDRGKGLRRWQLWFDEEHAYRLAAYVESVLRPVGGSVYDFLPLYIVGWDDPVEIGSVTVSQKCTLRFYDIFSTVVEGTRSSDDWPYRAFERLRFDYTLANIKVNEPLDAALFDVQPVAGTNVIDEPKGYRYLTGNAGEELQKTALAERARRPPEEVEAKRAVRWRIVLYSVNAVLLLVVLIVWFVMRRR